MDEAVVNASLKLLDLIEPSKRREIIRFVEARRHCQDSDELCHMKWVAEAMELMSQTRLGNEQKKSLVVALYEDLAKDNSNNFKERFDVKSAIEFVWDASRNRFGVVLRRKGCLANCLPCCSDVSLISEQGQIKMDVNLVKEPTPAR